jgi:predicted nucleotidyltransferase/DNA-binding XRE family transcriptional regulator
MGGQVSGSESARRAKLPASHADRYSREDLRQALIAARLAAGLTQGELAARIGTTQSAIARLESGAVTPTVETLGRLAEALELRFEIVPGVGLIAFPHPTRGLTLEDLRARRDEILRIAHAHGAQNVRVFGSVARGVADAASDVDLLVDIFADVKGFKYFGLLEELQQALADLLRRKVDVVDARSLGTNREPILREAVAV